MTDYSNYTLQRISEVNALAQALQEKSGIDRALSVSEMTEFARLLIVGEGYSPDSIIFTEADDTGALAEDCVFLNKSELEALSVALQQRSGYEGALSITQMTDIVNSFEGGTSYSTDGLIFSEVDGGYSVAGYEGTEADIFIGSHYNDLPILSIGNDAFNANTVIKTVTFSVYSQITSIGSQAFLGSSIEKLISPNSVTRFGTGCFRECKKLNEIILPPDINSIAVFMFYSCTALRSIDIPEKVTVINDMSFQGSGLDSIVIPPKVTTIKNQAFGWCPNLRTAYIPTSATSIQKVFQPYGKNSITIYCEFAEDAVEGAPWGATYGEVIYGSTDGLIFEEAEGGYAVVGYKGTDTDIVIGAHHNRLPIVAIADNAFYENYSITSVIINGNVKSIGDSAFYMCNSMTSLVIGDGVKSIGNGAFSWCQALEGVNIPDSVVEVGNYAFEWCYPMYSVTLGANCKSMPPDVFIESGVISITANYDDNIITNAPWGAWNAEITYNTEYSTYGLIFEAGDYDEFLNPASYRVTGFEYDEQKSSGSIVIASIHNGKPVTAIGDGAFEYNENTGTNMISSITVAEGISSVGKRAFAALPWLNISLPSTVDTISEEMFADCYELGYTISPNIRYIEDRAFYGAHLYELRFLEDGLIEKIGENAFSHCYIERAYFPPIFTDSANTISATAFTDCNDLTDIYCDFVYEAYPHLIENAPWGAPNAQLHFTKAARTYNASGDSDGYCYGCDSITVFAPGAVGYDCYYEDLPFDTKKYTGTWAHAFAPDEVTYSFSLYLQYNSGYLRADLGESVTIESEIPWAYEDISALFSGAFITGGITNVNGDRILSCGAANIWQVE